MESSGQQSQHSVLTYGHMGIGTGCADRMTCLSVPVSSTICCTTCPGGTCTGSGMGGDAFVEIIRTLAGPGGGGRGLKPTNSSK